MNLEAFIVELTNLWTDHDHMDIDGADFQDMLVKHGLLLETKATAEDCETEYAQDYGVEIGDPWCVYAPELIAIRKRATAMEAAA